MATKTQITEMQSFANRAGVPLAVTGRNNWYTRRFVSTFQAAMCLGAHAHTPLVVDGDPGPATMEAVSMCEDHGMRLSANFKITEFLTKGERKVTWQNEVVKVDRQLVLSLQKLRDNAATGIWLLSAYRDPAHNKRIGGATRSQHLFGKAVDLDRKRSPRISESAARAAGFNGIGMLSRTSPDVIHMDVRATTARWYYQ